MTPQNSFEPQARTALDKLAQDARSASSLRSILADYGIAAFLTLCYAFIAWLQDSSSAILFFGMLVIVLSFHSVSEQRADRRNKMLLDALNEIERRTNRHDTPGTLRNVA